jgi:hypothetical protein
MRASIGELLTAATEPREHALAAHRAHADAGHAEGVDVPSVDRAEALRDQAIERLADQLAGRVAERRLGGRVEERDLLVGVDGDDRIGGGRDHAAEPRLRLRGRIPPPARLADGPGAGLRSGRR